ncbi:MAG: hypothetical protein IJH39_01315 [Clostridia bacterium]|nr:hypothetical protein [Clostridia bacterium]
MKLKDKELWLELYEVAKNIQMLEPWKYLWDMDLLMYVSEEMQDVFYCSVMGRGGMHKAIAVYQGNQINGFLDLAKNQYPNYMLVNYQECLMCNFINRQETLPKNRELIKELGLSFRGTWVSFECFEKGYEPSPINIKQVKVMIEALKNFYMMFRAIIEKGMKVDFERGEVLARHYDKNKKLYLNYPNQLMIPKKEFDIIGLKEEFRNEIMKLPQTEMELEFEFLNYFPMRIRENKEQDGRIYYPRVRFIADRKTGFVISHDFINKNDYKDEKEYVIESAELLINYFYKFGRPKRIYVRDEESKMYLNELVDKAQIKLTVRPTLKAIDEFYKSMDRMM